MKIGSGLGQGFESHTFQVNFGLLKLIKMLITNRVIYVHLKHYSGCKKSKKLDLFSEGLPITVQWLKKQIGQGLTQNGKISCSSVNSE